jgi:hypothetical protein
LHAVIQHFSGVNRIISAILGHSKGMLDYQTWSNICSFTDKKEQVYTWFVPTCYHYHCHHHTTFFYPYVFCALASFTSLLVSKQELSLSLSLTVILLVIMEEAGWLLWEEMSISVLLLFIHSDNCALAFSCGISPWLEM